MKKLLLICALCTGAFSLTHAQTAASDAKNNGPIVAVNYTFADANTNTYGLTFAYEQTIFDIFSLGGGLRFDLISTNARSQRIIMGFNPFARAKIAVLRRPTSPFLTFDVGYYASESAYSENAPVNGISLTPSVGMDFSVGGSGKIRVAAGLLCVIVVGHGEKVNYGYGNIESDKSNSSNFIVSVGYKF